MNIGERITVDPAPTGEAHGAESYELSISDALAFARYYWPLVAATAACAVALAIAYVVTAQPTFTSTAQLLIETAQQSAPTLTMSESVVALDTPQIESEIALLNSEQIIGKAVKILNKEDAHAPKAPPAKAGAAKAQKESAQPKPAEPAEKPSWIYRMLFGEPAEETKAQEASHLKDEISAIQQGLDVKRMGLSYVLVLSYKSTDSVRAAAVVNALGDAYVQDKIDRRIESARQNGLWLETRIEEIRHLMNEAALDVQAFKARRDYRITERPDGFDKDGTFNLGTEFPPNPGAKPSDGKDKVQSEPQEAPTLEELDSRAQTYRKIYESYLQAYTDTVQRQSYPSTNARVIARGEVPLTKSGPRRALTLIGSLVIGSFMGFALALVHLSFDHTVRSGRQIWQNLRTPLLGEVDQIGALKHFSFGRFLGHCPQISARSSSARPIIHFSPSSRTATQLAEATLAVQEAAHRYGVDVVGFIDTRSGATSATMCANVALLNAQAGKRTLLVETDPKMDGMPTVAGMVRAGLMDVLEGTVSLDAGGAPSKFEPNLFVLNIGTAYDRSCWTPENAAALRQLLDRCKTYYDTIFVHLPPVKANHASPAVEGIVIVTAKGETVVRELVDAATLLRISDKPLLGVIISGLA